MIVQFNRLIPTPEERAFIDRRLLDLRELGMTCRQIGIAVGYYDGAPLSERQVEWRLRALGVPRRSRMARR